MEHNSPYQPWLNPIRQKELKLLPDAWPRFERFIRDIAKAEPQHRKPKPKTKSSKSPKAKKKAPRKRG
jgi:hypothetical protein